MNDTRQAVVCRKDYRPFAYAIDLIDLCFDLGLPVTRVTARIDFRRDRACTEPLALNGEGPKLIELRLNDRPLPAASYRLSDRALIIRDLPECGQLQIVAEVAPGGVGSEGLICLNGAFVTHCEPEGFRRLMFVPDRPDVMARYRCMLIADADRYPTLLSNGHLTERGTLPAGRHFARWEDPFPKASYLFALVAGRFTEIQRSFVTCSGRAVSVSIHCDQEDAPYTQLGIATLLQAMRWDEEAYGREYDLDVLNVAVLRNYPGGGMENKGLNLYSTEFFLASGEISTDDELRRVQAVIAHEYFHNWTGNRVGCRSWFELSLKEGFTIFRQQQFMAALRGEHDARIDDILRLQELQYPEDEGGMAHAVRPETYVTASNLYTKTVYEKGAEIIRMLYLLVGAASFRAAADTFFARFDGTAATIDDLLDTVEQVCSRNLSMFRRWYCVVGAARLALKTHYCAVRRRYSISFVQTAPGESLVLELPLRISLLGRDGTALPLHGPEQQTEVIERTHTLVATEQTLTFDGLGEKPVLLLRGFTAPVRLAADLEVDDLVLLARNVHDPVSRWSAAQRLAELALAGSSEGSATQGWFDVVLCALEDNTLDPAVAGRLLQLPSEKRLAERSALIDVEGIHVARTALARRTGATFAAEFRDTYLGLSALAQTPAGDGARRLRNACLWYLMKAAPDDHADLCRKQLYADALLDNTWHAARCLIDRGGTDREFVLGETHARWHRQPALLDHWFSAQAASDADDCAQRVVSLVGHPDLPLDNSARLKATFDTFADNQHALHAASGAGYDAVLRMVQALNDVNPRLAARFLRRLDGWTRLDERRRCAVVERLRLVLAAPHLAPELREIATKSLESPTAS